MQTGDYVEIKEHNGSAWRWTDRNGHVTATDKYCLEVRADDGELVRDVREHFQPAATDCQGQLQ